MANHRYQMVFDEELYAALQAYAEEHGMTMHDVVQRFCKIGLYLDTIDQNPKQELAIRENGQFHILKLI